MKIDELLQKLEGKSLEFKKKVPSSNAISRTACAFSNGAGGRIIIGISDKMRKVVGIDENKVFEIEEKMTNILHTTITPQISFEIMKYSYSRKLLLIVEIFPGNMTPYFIKSKGKNKGTIIRVGSSNRNADEDTISELERRRYGISYDMVAVPNQTIEVIDKELVQQYIHNRKEKRGIPEVEITEQFLENIKAITRINSTLRPTVGGILLFSNKIGEILDLAKITCARFKGTKMGEFIDEKVYAQPLDQQVKEVIKFVMAHIKKGGKIEGIYRKDRYEYPLLALREAIINAVCHRDYSVRGSDIKLAIFDDRIEITSPGDLPGKLTVEDLGMGISEIRNHMVARIFNEMGLIERWGQGITNIRNLCREWGIKAPEFKEHGYFFKVIFYNGKGPLIDKFESTLDADQKAIINVVTDKGEVSTQECIEITGKSERTVQRKLRDLIDKKRIIWTGTHKNDPKGVYKLGNK